MLSYRISEVFAIGRANLRSHTDTADIFALVPSTLVLLLRPFTLLARGGIDELLEARDKVL